MRITSRMTQIIAWMLCQRAVQSGEMTQERALSEEFAIGGDDVCLDDRWTDDGRLPPGIRGLLDRSLRLSVRVRRLDQMLPRPARSACRPPRPPPADRPGVRHAKRVSVPLH